MGKSGLLHLFFLLVCGWSLLRLVFTAGLAKYRESWPVIAEGGAPALVALWSMVWPAIIPCGLYFAICIEMIAEMLP
ncbi:hypothetical protein TH8_19775 [Thalassospira profundimaris]|nr:hypothetical protein TH8_19775 [Thalassospira profundimaris]